MRKQDIIQSLKVNVKELKEDRLERHCLLPVVEKLQVIDNGVKKKIKEEIFRFNAMFWNCTPCFKFNRNSVI